MLRRLLDVRPEERRPAAIAFLVLFGTLAAHTILETARDALFLARLPPSQLPWMYLAMAGIAAGLSEWTARRLSGPRALATLLAVCAAGTFTFWAIGPSLGPWRLRALYVWTGLVSIKGAQGNFPLHRTLADDYTSAPDVASVRRGERSLYAAPWLTPDAYPDLDRRSLKEIVALHKAIPPGVIARHGTSPLVPAKVPDLIGVRERQYLDATGLERHRDVGDLMRYAAKNQTTDLLSRYRDFMPAESFVGAPVRDPVQFFQAIGGGRYSDEQLYALALYIYSLKPPANPNTSTVLTSRGEQAFNREGCRTCHTPPLYTNNKLTIATGFVPQEDLFQKYDIMRLSVGTDPDLALKTRRGTGFYKVPSLKGVWYRGPFGHSGWVATLEDWFDERRLRADYVPTGFNARGVGPRAVTGHPFGLQLSAGDKQALIAFLRTL